MPGPGPEPTGPTRVLRLVGTVPPEVWNRLGTKILPKFRSSSDLKIGLEFSVTVPGDSPMPGHFIEPQPAGDCPQAAIAPGWLWSPRGRCLDAIEVCPFILNRELSH
jgi:hypothetical protein